MMMKKNTELLIRKLKIDKDDRLEFCADDVKIFKPSFTTSMRRTILGEGRDSMITSMDKLLDDVDRLLADFQREIIVVKQRERFNDESQVSMTEYDRNIFTDMTRHIARLRPEIVLLAEQNEKGLNALKETYATDKITMAGLECISDRIPFIINAIDLLAKQIETK